MRTLGLLIVALTLVGCSKKVDGESRSESFASNEPPASSQPTNQQKVAGRIKATQLLDEAYNPKSQTKRAAVDEKYAGKYWEIILTIEAVHIDSDFLVSNFTPFDTQYHTWIYFRERRDLLRYKSSVGKFEGPMLIVGKVVNVHKIEDCYIP